MFNKIKKRLSMALISALIAGIFFSNFSHVFAGKVVNDIELSSDFAKEAVTALSIVDIINGDENGNFHPHRAITRLEMVKFIVDALELNTSIVPEEASFKDIPPEHWGFKYIEAAYRNEIIKGLPDGTFDGSRICTREQVAAMLVRALGLSDTAVKKYGENKNRENYAGGNNASAHNFLANIEGLNDRENISPWAEGLVDFALSSGLMAGTGNDTFAPDAYAEKEQAALIIFRFLVRKDEILYKSQEILDEVYPEINMTFNGDTVESSIRPAIRNAMLFVPAEVFAEAGAQVSMDTFTGLIKISLEGTKTRLTGADNIFLKEGYAYAYISYMGDRDPYIAGKDSDPYKYDIDAAPGIYYGNLLVPARTVASALGMKVNWDDLNSVIEINDENTVMHPNLYEAFENEVNTKKSFSIDTLISLKDLRSNAYLTRLMSMDGLLDNEIYEGIAWLNTRITGISEEIIQYSFNFDGRIINYKLSSRDELNISSFSDMKDEGMLYWSIEDVWRNNNIILEQYNNINFIRSGKAIVDGKDTVEYHAMLDRNTASNLLDESIFARDVTMDEIYSSDGGFILKIHVDENKNIVREAIEYEGKILQSGMPVYANLRFGCSFKGIK